VRCPHSSVYHLRCGVQWAVSSSTRKSSQRTVPASPSSQGVGPCLWAAPQECGTLNPGAAGLPATLHRSWRQGWPSTCKHLEARIQQGVVPRTIPGYAAKTDCPFSISLVSIVAYFPTSGHLAVGQLLRAEEGTGPPQNGYKPALKVC